jgi:hypothetical protein
MSDKEPGFVGKDIQCVQREIFLGDLAGNGGRWRYRAAGLLAPAGTIVLFQYRARIIALAEFLRNEKFAKAKGGCKGAMYIDVKTIRTFDPVDVEGMRKAWPGFRGFGHVKQKLNAACWPVFRRRLKGVRAPLIRGLPKAAGDR